MTIQSMLSCPLPWLALTWYSPITTESMFIQPAFKDLNIRTLKRIMQVPSTPPRTDASLFVTRLSIIVFSHMMIPQAKDSWNRIQQQFTQKNDKS